MSILIIAPLVANAHVEDVVPRDFKYGSLYVRVTKTNDNNVIFKSCRKGMEPQTCSPLGRKAPYTIEELENARRSKNWDAVLATIVDAAIIFAAAPYAGIVVAVLLGSGTAGLGVLIGTLEAGSLVAIAATGLNPVAQLQLADTVSNDIINDKKDVPVKNMEKFISRFSKVLSNIR